MSTFDLQKILEAWILATGKDKLDFDKVRIGVESDWLCHKAKQLLTKDSTGVLSAFAMRAAYIKYISEHSMSVKDLVEGEWDKVRGYWDNLYNQLYVENAGPLISSAEDRIIDILSALGEHLTKEELQENDFENVFVDAFDKYDRYKADVFQNPCCVAPVNNLRVSKKLHYFEHYKQFVDALKQTTEENMLVVSFIGRTAETCTTEYDENFDKFFAFGVKRGEGIAVVSDRVVHSSLEFNSKTRNPARELQNKIDFSHLPYYNYEQIMNSSCVSDRLLEASTDSENTERFCEGFDIEGYIYIATILNIIYNKYFETCEGWSKKPVLFSSDVKFLTAGQSKELISKNDTTVILPEVTCSAIDYTGDENIFNHGLYDFYIDMFPVTDVIKFDFNAVATKEDMANNAWWAVRNAQAQAVTKGLKDSFNWDAQKKYNTFFADRIIENLKSIFEYTITHDDNKHFDKYICDRHGPSSDDPRPVISEEWSKQAELDTVQVSSVQYKSTADWFHPKYWQSYVTVDHMRATSTSSVVDVWWEDDNTNRSVDLKFMFRSYSDLVKHLKFDSIEDLPKEFQHWLYPRVDNWGIISWKPYRGNSILSFTDPMNDIDDPWHTYPVYVVFHMSKSKYNKLVKQYGNLRTCKLPVTED